MMGCGCKDVLLLGGSDGLALRELLKYKKLKSVTLVDLYPFVTERAIQNPYIKQLNQSLLENSRVSAISEDAFVYLNQTNQYFNLIIIDQTDPNNTFRARLYNREFYAMVRQRLNRKGRFVTQATSPYFAIKVFWSINNTIDVAGFSSVLP